jgi:hypothetical protein
MTDIPITANERKAQFTGNTGLGPFAFTFNILTNSDIRVIKNSTVLTLTSNTLSPPMSMARGLLRSRAAATARL